MVGVSKRGVHQQSAFICIIIVELMIIAARQPCARTQLPTLSISTTTNTI
jgi:hypothetical protein